MGYYEAGPLYRLRAIVLRGGGGGGGRENGMFVHLFRSLEALPVDDGGAGLVVLLFGDPHLLEGGQGGQDGATDPHRVLALWRSDDLDLHGLGSQGGDLLLHPVGDTGVHGGASGQHGVGVQILTDVDVALHDGVVGGLVDSRWTPYPGRTAGTTPRGSGISRCRW